MCPREIARCMIGSWTLGREASLRGDCEFHFGHVEFEELWDTGPSGSLMGQTLNECPGSRGSIFETHRLVEKKEM